MAWSKSYGTGAERKERESHLRRALNRSLLLDSERFGKGKRVNCSARKFGIAFRHRENVFSVRDKNVWQRYWARYETARQRDQALAALDRKEKCYEYKAIDL
jgi:hypothetical protein